MKAWESFTKYESFGCAKCEDGYTKIPKAIIGWEVEPCDCFINYKYRECVFSILAQSGLSKRHIKLYDFLKYKPTTTLPLQALNGLSSVPEPPKNWLFLYGNSGSGKTYTAIMAIYIAALNGKQSYFTSVVKLLDDLRPKDKDDLADKLLFYTQNVWLLVLDDIGHEKSSSWVRERLYAIINERWNKMLPTIFTSNFSLENLRINVSEAIYSRVKGASTVVSYAQMHDKRIN